MCGQFHCCVIFFAKVVTILITVGLLICLLRTRKQRERIERIQSVAYTPLDSYPTNTVSNSQFVAGDEDELLKDGGEISIQ